MADPTPAADLEGIAQLDLGRGARRGYPEAVFCEGKTADQVGRIARALADQPQVSLFTRVRSEHVDAITAVLPDAAYDADARLVAWPPTPPEPAGGDVLVLAAGTSDLPSTPPPRPNRSWSRRRPGGRPAPAAAGPDPCGRPRL